MAILLDTIRDRLSRIRGNVLRGIAHGLLVIAAVSAILVASVVTYVTFVRVYLPEISQTYDLDFIFATDCVKNPLRQEGLCSFPFANVTFPSSSTVFSRGQAYEVSLTLQLPESEKIFTSECFSLISRFTTMRVKHTTLPKSRQYFGTVRLCCASSIASFFYPFYVFGLLDETQTVQVDLLQGYLDNSYQPTRGLLVQLDSPFVEVYSAKLTIMAQLSGLRYLIYHHSLVSAAFGIAACASMFTFVGLISVLAFFLAARRRASSRDSADYDTLSSGSPDSQLTTQAGAASFIRSLSAGVNADVSSTSDAGNKKDN